MLTVPVPVRSPFGTPVASTWRTKSSYWPILPTIAARSGAGSRREERRLRSLLDDDPAVELVEAVRRVHRDDRGAVTGREKGAAQGGELAVARQPQLEGAAARLQASVRRP